MALVLDGTNGVSGVDGTASNPAIEGTDSNTGIFYPAADTVAIGTGGTERLRVDSAGNAGLGVTPQAWNASYKAFQIANTSSIMGGTSGNDTYYLTNAYFDSAWKYAVSSKQATRYEQVLGVHAWYNAPSGTAGNAITFTQAMTLDASGKLGVGSTAPSTILHLRTSAANLGVSQIFENSSGTEKNWLIGRNNTTGFEITPSTAAGGLTFTTPALVVDASGNLLVGTTSNPAGVKLVIGGTSGTARVEPVTDNVGYIGEGSYRWQAVYAVNGTIQTSDGREKNTIEDSNLGLSFVNSLRPVSYKWNVGENIVTYDEEGKEVVTPRAGVRTHYGFIAQEVKTAIPDGVDFGGFVQEPNEGMMSLRYHEFIGPLVKAIQELNAKVEALEAQLKGNA